MTLHNFDFDDDRWYQYPEQKTYAKTVSVEEKCITLFLTKSYHLILKVDDKIISESNSSSTLQSQNLKALWVRNVLRTKQSELETLGVNVKEEYTKWGGDSNDL